METLIKIPLPATLEGCETERFYFRKLEENDLEELMPFFTSDKCMEFLPFAVTPRENGLNWIARQQNRYNTNKDGIYALINKLDGKIIGMCGLIIQEVEDKKELEVGYHLLPEYWKKGYATEAAQFCKQFAFQHKMAESIISIIHINNKNSQKVAERNGLKREKQTTFKDLPAYIYRSVL